MRDLYNHIKIAESVRPAVHSATNNGQEVDLQGAASATFVATIGAIVGSGGDAFIEIQESDTSGSGFTAVADADLLGTEPTALTANTVYKVGYRGNKRYVRAVLNKGSETSVAGSVVAVLGHLGQSPDDAAFAS